MSDFLHIARWTAVTGHESTAHGPLSRALPEGLRLQTDALGNAWVRFGSPSGPPAAIAAAPLDEPGFVVSRITDAGWLRLRSCQPLPPAPLWQAWLQGRKVEVHTRGGRLCGAVTLPSVHLRRRRVGTARPPVRTEDLWVDVGAADRREAEARGLRLLDPVAPWKAPCALAGGRVAGPALGRRWGAAVLLDLARALADAGDDRSVVLLWLGQELAGRRGRDAASERWRGVRQLLWLGTEPPTDGDGPLPAHPRLRTTAGGEDPGAPEGWAREGLDPRTLEGNRYTGGPDWGGARQTLLEVPVENQGSPVETVSLDQVRAAAGLARKILEIPAPSRSVLDVTTGSDGGGRGRPAGEHAEALEILGPLVEASGVSGHEEPVAAVVEKHLPPELRSGLRRDEAGNRLLDLPGRAPGPRLLLVAHMDEIGFEVEGYDEDGRGRLRPRGGFLPVVFEAGPMVGSGPEGDVPAVLSARPAGKVEAGEPDALEPESLRLDLGTRDPEASRRLLPEGSPVRPYKSLHRLGLHRAATRSFDDRVGCAALLLALRHLDLRRVRHPATLAWSVREEVGLEGAKALSEGERRWDYVFAVDTFVSADSPLESDRFALAPLGGGAVLRSQDTSSITPADVRDGLMELGRRHGLRLQYGVTGGGNDGAVFTRLGTVDVPVSWPMRNAHSVAETIDLRDVEALAGLLRRILTSWEPPV